MPSTPAISLTKFTVVVETAPAVARRMPVRFESVNMFANKFDVEAVVAARFVTVVVAKVVVAENVFVFVNVLDENVFGRVVEAWMYALTRASL
jgi:hypothetical protein